MTKLKVILSTPVWSLNGINIFSETLVIGLQERGFQPQILITRPDWETPAPMPFPEDIEFTYLPVGKYASWRTRWGKMIERLERDAPCIYLPGYDFWHSCVSPLLSERIGIVGIVHSDDPQHYEHVIRLGMYWNAVVAVSKFITEKTDGINQTFNNRLTYIPYGVEVPDQLPVKEFSIEAPLRILYSGRLIQQQKRVMDLPEIVISLSESSIPFELSIIGSGPDEYLLRNALDLYVDSGKVHFLGTITHAEVMAQLRQSDTILFTSEYEGMPISLLEGMAYGCVPVVTDVQSGIPELVQHGENGYVNHVGDIQKFTANLAALHTDLEIRKKLSSEAYQTISAGRFSLDSMVRSYLDLFEEVADQIAQGTFVRPKGKIKPPPDLEWEGYLPTPLQAFGHWIKRQFYTPVN